MSRKPCGQGQDPFHLLPLTPGPLGHNDAAYPFCLTGLLGDTPGPLGVNDHAARLAFAAPAPKLTSLEKAFRRCQQLGWIPFFQEASLAYPFAPELLMAIGYRESGLNPKYLKVAGDNGHGYGLMQIDIRSYPAWVKAGHWKDARACILKGAEVLASKQDEITSSIGKKLSVRTLAGHTYHFHGEPISGPDLLRVTVAAYNCGLWAYYHYCKGHDVDQGTTGQDYSRDVLANMLRFKALLEVPEKYPASDLDLSHYA